ncbi:uncharacterized protein SCODWIG_00149 [Saccharomycodes ludwigii]|uniref:Uncharacterized protein n=1 Tax=Saccharomycodes ludwigii TaxID=36035 RepID=A0A376B128_9ASCO|nr:hypothetical protein SCDLUD_004239 [Saccharomycodes ludwigii]KAH3899924.1 hypothetical protein SCDLUD_004239 [Saccharomycodes ludwigii]SSD58388.1 uncharacterized protein SCODWIG_00149 [Saccharomycodes ludwigii]
MLDTNKNKKDNPSIDQYGWDSHIILLLLQIVLHRQQYLCHKDSNLSEVECAKNPVIDDFIFNTFINHKLVKYYNIMSKNTRNSVVPTDLTLEELKQIVRSIYSRGLPQNENNDPNTLVALCNYYYFKRIDELENNILPKIKKQLQQQQNKVLN